MSLGTGGDGKALARGRRVSMATLRAASTRYHHTELFSEILTCNTDQ